MPNFSLTCWIVAGPNGAGKTTFAVKYLPTVANCRNFLQYLALPTSVDMSILRVAHGGHNISVEDIERRFSRSLRNLLNEFSCAVDRTQCFMNSGDIPQPVFIQQGKTREILNPELFKQLAQEAE